MCGQDIIHYGRITRHIKTDILHFNLSHYLICNPISWNMQLPSEASVPAIVHVKHIVANGMSAYYTQQPL